MSFFSRVFRSKDSSSAKKQSKQKAVDTTTPAKPRWTDAYSRIEIAPEEVQDLIKGCTQELKTRGLKIPFLLLPFRPSSDPSAARTFIRNFFNAEQRGSPLRGEVLMQELRLTEPMVLCSVLKWCWSRLPGGVVTWEAYELFKVGEQDSNFARDAFSTFIPLSVESDARTKIIFDFFDLLASIAAHGKSNGLGGRKLSRYAGWWAFEHSDTGNGFEASYRTWATAADATSHLFFAYLRSMSPDSLRGVNGISALPIALQSLVQATEYPPETPTLLQVTTTKVVMIVDTVSPTPVSLLRRARNFEYRESDHHLQEFSDYEDPVTALTDECLRVLKAISGANVSAVSTTKTSTSLRDASWSRFEDMGFAASIESDHDEESEVQKPASVQELRSAPHTRTNDLGRPTTPSWADFLSTGFTDENGNIHTPSLLLPPDKVLPPIVRGQSSQSHKRTLDNESALGPGELASITTLDLDDSFWWVWITSLSGEEPSARKAVFGRCALLETIITGAKWLVLEEQVKGAAPEPEPGAYIAEKKRFFTFSSRRRLTRRKSSGKKTLSQDPYKSKNATAPTSKTSIAPDQHARIQAAAAALQRKHREQEEEQQRETVNGRRARSEDTYSIKTNSVMTMHTGIFSEASQAMKWASNYDKDAVRSAYLSNSRAGTGALTETLDFNSQRNMSPVSEIPSSLQTPTPATPQQPAPLPVPPKDAPKIANDDAADAATVPLPDVVTVPRPDAATVPRPVASTERPRPEALVAERRDTEEADPKKSIESTDDSRGKKLKKKPANSAFKGIFSSTKKRTDNVPTKQIGIDPSAVAAARAALENKVKSQDMLPPPKTPVNNRVSTIRKKSVAEAPIAAVEERKAAPVVAQEEVVQVMSEPEATAPEVPDSTPFTGPPRTRRDDEYDALSRIDTNEKAMADREFSSFDQGPLLEQPAFAPDSPVSPVRPSVEEAPTPVARDIETPTQPAKAAAEPSSISPQDRWTQSRKNAAERAAAALEDAPPRRTSQADRTDDGDTSGEETIESRVARIKARVAELTGNMEAAR